MTSYRLIVTERSGLVVIVEFHDTVASANERATGYRSRGYDAEVTEGTRDADGFTPRSGP